VENRGGILNSTGLGIMQTKRNILFITRTAILMALTLVIQMMNLPQYATGPLVNTMLYVAAVFVGVWGGVAIGLITPLIAFWRGILPLPLGPMIPFIALGNAVLVIIYGLTRKRNKYISVIAASIVKFLLLSIAVRFVVDVPPKIAQMMQVPQLITAIAGGAIAIILSEILIRRGMLKPLSRM
jgi:thiamine transporter ThiT